MEAELARSQQLTQARELARLAMASEEALGRFKSILDSSPDMIFMFDPESLQFTYLNEGAVKGMGYLRE